jgi:phage terminase Nu1 subunit (DNA packaging protein)
MGRPVSVNASPDLDAARLRKENALAEKYELQVERERGELLVAERVERDWLQSAQVIRNKLIGLPASVAPQLEGMTAAEMQTLLETRVNEILNELADGFEADETTSEGAAASAPSQAE